MINIVLCGGSGTRLWPLSRKLLPKQFVRLFDDRSLYQLTLERNANLCDSFIVVTGKDHYFLAFDQANELDKLSDLDSLKFLLEPVGRNTAPAIALAAFGVDKEEIIFVTPSDHLIKNINEYKSCVARGRELAKDGYLVTFGIKPTYPETGYGYIEADGESVISFKEKPDYETAKSYLEKNNSNSVRYYWNSGMFCFKAGVYLEELEKYSPEIFRYAKLAFENKKDDGNVVRIDYESMIKIPENSIDYAVMEKSDKVKVVQSDFEWNDLGSFESLYNEIEKDNEGNTKTENAVLIDSKNNLIITSDRDVALVDVSDLMVVDTEDALLIAKKGSGQKVKDVVSKIKRSNPELLETHKKVERPWGSFEVLLNGSGYKIKRIIVKPNSKLSLQKHLHRNEHWIVVSGTATVTVGDKKYYVRPNEST
ncbi:MAG: mannose-1-phosphate guanylyltransferase/mannose-6-phosphate isomerase, partial [Nitrososphaeria archaeon]